MARWFGLRLDYISNFLLVAVAFTSIPLVSMKGILLSIASSVVNYLVTIIILLCRFSFESFSFGSWIHLHFYIGWNVSILC